MLEGCVEIRFYDFWGMICDDYWILREVNVVCRFMGFGIVVGVIRVVYFGKGVGKVNNINRLFVIIWLCGFF